MYVKICGITRLEDALAAISAGADFLGYNFYPHSKRYLPPARAARIHAEVRRRAPYVRGVGVFVNAAPESILHTLAQAGLDLAQLHGDEPPEALATLGGRAFKALRLRSLSETRQALALLPPRREPPAFLVDAWHPAAYGGSGQTADWQAARQLRDAAPPEMQAFFLAGGLTPENVRAACAQVSPWGVDAASGVESAPGIKDHLKMRQFIQAAKSFSQESV
ncbi:MAG: phosphoribosylanthranilate isomerase [Anaerolineales bacterium]